MSADDLQRCASILRWLGLGLTAIGCLLTAFSFRVADSLMEVRRREKTKLQEQLHSSVAHLAVAQGRVAELERRVAPRQLSGEQHQRFRAMLADCPKGSVKLALSDTHPETIAFLKQMGGLLVEAGFTIQDLSDQPIDVNFSGPWPWFVSIVVHPDRHPPYTQRIHEAFKSIGIEAVFSDGTWIGAMDDFTLHIGAK